MDFWINFWTVCFLLSILVFAGVAVVVAIGGISDIRALFNRIDEQHQSHDTEAV